MNNIAVKCYQSLLEMETENQKINEMIIAPKFAKLLNESADADDYAIHRTKTIETVSEFVNKAFDSMISLLSEVSLEIEENKLNNRLVLTCENKLKSLTKEDRDNFVLEDTYLFESINEYKSGIVKDIKTVIADLSKILECSFKTKEEYSKNISSFKQLISECDSRLHDHKYEGNKVSVDELSNILNNYKNTDILVESDISTLNEIKENLGKCKDSVKSENLLKIKEAVYGATNYLMTAFTTVEELAARSYMNNVGILCEFVYGQTSDESTALFESTMSNIIRQNSNDDDDYEDFI